MTLGDVDVVIVGAGPVGLVTAIALAQKGVSFLIVDTLAERQNTSRAAVVHARTLDALDEIGMAAPLIAQGIKVPLFCVRDRSRVLLSGDFNTLDAPFPFLLMIPQDETEGLLVAQLRDLGHEALRPATATRIEHGTDDGARVEIDAPSGGRTIACRYVVGADGQHSRVRDGAGIDFPGSTYGSFLLADVRMDWPLGHAEVTLFVSADGTLVVAPMSGGRHRVVAAIADAPAEPTAGDVQGLIDARGPLGGGHVNEVIWGSRFKVSHRLASTFRSGPFVLAGDAAHVHSPAGGQGMNLGLRDAVALADALAHALTRPSGEAALDRYAVAQRKAAQEVLAMTDRLTRVATVQSRTARIARNQALQLLGLVPGVQRKLTRALAGYD